MVSTWKRELLENAPDLFEGKKKSGKQSSEPSSDELYREIGRLTVERDFLELWSFLVYEEVERMAYPVD